MISFVHYRSARCEEWDHFVSSNPEGAMGHLSSQFLLAEQNAGTINRSMLIYRDSVQLVGVLPLCETKSIALKVIPIRILASTAGPLFLESLAASEKRDLLDLLLAYVSSLADDLGIDRISISYPSIIEGQLAVERFGFFPLKKYGYSESNMLGTYIDLGRSDSDLMASLENTCRNKLRKAAREGVQILPIEKREDWLSYESMNQQALGKYSYSRRTMEVAWDEFISKGHAYAFAAMHENRALSVVVIQSFHRNAYYWMAFNAKPSFPGANNYLLWNSILYAKKLGLSFFLMGTLDFSDDAKTQGISDFKKSFGGIPYYVLGGTLVRRKIKHLSMLLFLEVTRHFRGLGRALKLNRRSSAANRPTVANRPPASPHKAV